MLTQFVTVIPMDTCVAHALPYCLFMFHVLLLFQGEVKSSVILDHEVTPNYRLVAHATDGGGQWCRAEVKLLVTDVNDNPPNFTLSQYTTSVYEDTVPKALLTRIQAIDPDEGITTSTSTTCITTGVVTNASSLNFIRPITH